MTHDLLDDLTIQIDDPELSTKYNERRHAAINQSNKLITATRLIYNMFIFV